MMSSFFPSFFQYKGEYKFFLKWKGYSSKYNTWEPESNLFCANLLDAYKEKFNLYSSFQTLKSHMSEPKLNVKLNSSDEYVSSVPDQISPNFQSSCCKSKPKDKTSHINDPYDSKTHSLSGTHLNGKSMPPAPNGKVQVTRKWPPIPTSKRVQLQLHTEDKKVKENHMVTKRNGICHCDKRKTLHRKRSFATRTRKLKRKCMKLIVSINLVHFWRDNISQTKLPSSVHSLEHQFCRSSANVCTITGSTSDSAANMHTSTASVRNCSANVRTSTAHVHTSTAQVCASTAHLSTSSADVSTSSANVRTSSANVCTSSASVSTSSASVSTSSACVRNSSANVSTSSASVRTSSANARTSSANVRTSSANVRTSSANVSSSSTNIRTSSTNIRTSSANVRTSSAYVHTSSGNIRTSSANVRCSSANVHAGTAHESISTASACASTVPVSPSTASISTRTANVCTNTASKGSTNHCTFATKHCLMCIDHDHAYFSPLSLDSTKSPSANLNEGYSSSCIAYRPLSPLHSPTYLAYTNKPLCEVTISPPQYYHVPSEDSDSSVISISSDTCGELNMCVPILPTSRVNNDLKLYMSPSPSSSDLDVCEIEDNGDHEGLFIPDAKYSSMSHYLPKVIKERTVPILQLSKSDLTGSNLPRRRKGPVPLPRSFSKRYSNMSVLRTKAAKFQMLEKKGKTSRKKHRLLRNRHCLKRSLTRLLHNDDSNHRVASQTSKAPLPVVINGANNHVASKATKAPLPVVVISGANNLVSKATKAPLPVVINGANNHVTSKATKAPLPVVMINVANNLLSKATKAPLPGMINGANNLLSKAIKAPLPVVINGANNLLSKATKAPLPVVINGENNHVTSKATKAPLPVVMINVANNLVSKATKAPLPGMINGANNLLSKAIKAPLPVVINGANNLLSKATKAPLPVVINGENNHVASKATKAPLPVVMINGENNHVVSKASDAPLQVIKISLSERRLSYQYVSECAYKDHLMNWQYDLNKQRNGTDDIIIVENEVDRDPPPLDFNYISASIYREGVPDPDSLDLRSSLCGCECYYLGRKCGLKSQYCCARMAGSKFAYTQGGKVRVPPGTPIYECNPKCACPSSCINRVVQLGRKVPLCIFRTVGRGWGVKSMQPIKCHTFVSEYVGEVITNEEAERRGEMCDAQGITYLFDLDFEDDNSAFTVDAANYGNISHFFNHSVSFFVNF